VYVTMAEERDRDPATLRIQNARPSTFFALVAFHVLLDPSTSDIIYNAYFTNDGFRIKNAPPRRTDKEYRHKQVSDRKSQWTRA
jgi:hypothetical protein